MIIKKMILVLGIILILIPHQVLAISPLYEDKSYNVVGEEMSPDKINIYFFYGDGCGYCAREEDFLDDLYEKYSDNIQIFRYETTKNTQNKSLMLSLKTLFEKPANQGVPFTIMGSESYSGYNDYVGEKIEKQLIDYLELDVTEKDETIIEKNNEQIPFMGEVNVKEVSVGVLAVVLGFVDGFNPCAMWILLFLINMLFGMKNKKKMLLLGTVFLTVSAAVYFLSMLGLTTVFAAISVPLIRSIIGIIALIIGLYNIKKYNETKDEEAGCHIVNESKRKKIFTRIKKFTTEKNLLLALGGVIILAISVNVIELACSTVFPAMFAEILAINDVTGGLKIIYLLIYTLFYMIDDLIIFVIAVSTLSIKTASSKYGKYSSLIGGIIMIIMGILLIFKPEWIMLNF